MPSSSQSRIAPPSWTVASVERPIDADRSGTSIAPCSVRGSSSRERRDLTIGTWAVGVVWALEATTTPEGEGSSIEVIDLRRRLPWDRDAVLASVSKTSRVVVLHEAPETGGFGGEIAAAIGLDAFDKLDAPVTRVAGLDRPPVPFSKKLEAIYSPQGRLLPAIRRVLAH